jgi:hypothetical protein
MEWSDLFQSGSVVDLNVGYWRARVKITPEDLGIPNTDNVRAALNLGSHRLAPAEAFDGLHWAAGLATTAINKYTIPFALIRGARFVPNASLALLRGELEAARAAFGKAADAFVEKYDDTRTSMEPVLREALQAAAHSPEAAEVALMRLRSKYPTAQDVRRSFKLRWDVYVLASPTAKEAREEARAATEQVRSVVREMVESLRNEVRDKVANLVRIVSKGGRLGDASIAAANRVIERVREMNRTVGDPGLRESLTVLAKLLNASRAEGDALALFQGLQAVEATLIADVDTAAAAAEAALMRVASKRQIG